MSRNSGNLAKTKNLISGSAPDSKHNRKSFHKLSDDSSSISSNRNTSGHSEDDVRITGAYLRPQVDKNASYEEQEQAKKKLQAQVKELRHKLRVLEESVDSKDYSLGTIAREKDRAVGEIRRLERSNKLLRQQLSDERTHYLEEKEKFCEEMTKFKKKLQEAKSETEGKKLQPHGKEPLISQSLRWQLSNDKGDFVEEKPAIHPKKPKTQRPSGVKERISSAQWSLSFTESQIRKPSSIESLHLYEGDDISLQMAALRTENAKLRSIICERDEQNYELCLRFLRMKHYKNDIKNRFQDLENEYLQVIANLMDKIDEARQEFNFIIDQKFKRPLHSTNAMYLQMVQKNSRMAFENASLRLENQCLKKELNKKNEVTDVSGVVELEEKTSTEKTRAKVKPTGKKNVNFNEVRTIYERYLTFKNSDTDSNYMSKTSTTVPSNGSLGDRKSNESVAEGGKNNQNQLPMQPNALPDEILKKIFKRIDTSSCATVDTGRSNPQIPNKTVTNLPQEEEKSTKMERKTPPKITDSSSPCESTKSLRMESKASESGRGSGKLPETNARRQGKQESLKTRIKTRVRCDWNLDRDSEGSSSLDFPLRKFTLTGRSRSGRQEKTQEPLQGRKLRPRRFEDSCGLQEKLEFSDLELPAAASLPGVGPPMAGDATRSTARDKPVPIESEEEELGDSLGSRQGMKAIAPAIGSRSRSSNKLNLRDELEQAATRQERPTVMEANSKDRFSQNLKGDRLDRVQSRTSIKTYRSGKRSSSTSKNLQCNLETCNRDAGRTMQEPEGPQQRKPEASKRFSHRLISTSPEQLKSILTESQLGSFRMAPVVVGHATTEIVPPFKCTKQSNEIFLQLVLPPPTSPKQSSIFSDNEMERGVIIEKEASLCEISSVRPRKSSNQMETCASDIRIPISSVPTSNSTMEMVDSAAFERNNIIMRTLSAPGLLESSWLDPYTICEMRDCSTNT